MGQRSANNPIDTTTRDVTPVLSSTTAGACSVAWRLHVVATPDPRLAGRQRDLAPGVTQIGRGCNGMVIDDPAVSRAHISVQASSDGVWLSDLHSKNGTSVTGQQVQQRLLGDGAVVRMGATVLVLEANNGVAEQYAEPTANIPGRSEKARLTRFEIAIAAAQSLHVLLIGQTGTGKEHAALEIHRLAKRSGPLVRFNVAAVPAELFESELFGHVPGAFTGATVVRQGRVREANHGTLVLDEIGELPLPLQAKLLRVLEEGLVRPVGASADVKVDVRFVASTNADLDERADKGLFRRDLLARLRANTVHLPPLSARRADLLDLADAVQPATERGKVVPWRQVLAPEAVEALLMASYPDNLRTLRGALSRARALAGSDRVGVEHLPAEMLRKVAVVQAAAATMTPTEARRPPPGKLREALARHRGNVDAVAKEFGAHRRQVYRWFEYAGIGKEEVAGVREAPTLAVAQGGTGGAR